MGVTITVSLKWKNEELLAEKTSADQ